MTNDPVCGMAVSEETARSKGLVVVKNGKEYFFCSEECKAKFTHKNWIPYALGVVLTGLALYAYFFNQMLRVMGGIFLVLSILKMIDWKGFIVAFKQYDLFARYVPGYSAVYPAIELFFAFAYLSGLLVAPAAIVTVIVMLVGAAGILKNLLSKTKVQCACLGTKIKIPLTGFTLFEDLVMAAMALMVLIGKPL
jgi:YHS domain-containing protein